MVARMREIERERERREKDSRDKIYPSTGSPMTYFL
jgi:hypothetical protein